MKQFEDMVFELSFEQCFGWHSVNDPSLKFLQVHRAIVGFKGPDVQGNKTYRIPCEPQDMKSRQNEVATKCSEIGFEESSQRWSEVGSDAGLFLRREQESRLLDSELLSTYLGAPPKPTQVGTAMILSQIVAACRNV